MLRRTTSILLADGESAGTVSLEGPSSRSAPSAILIAPDGSAVMASPDALEMLRDAVGEKAAGGFASLPQAFRTRLRELRHALLTSAAPITALSGGLMCRACTLRGDGGDYLLVLLERPGRRDAAREHLAMFGFTPREHEVAELVRGLK